MTTTEFIEAVLLVLVLVVFLAVLAVHRRAVRRHLAIKRANTPEWRSARFEQVYVPPVRGEQEFYDWHQDGL